MNLDIYRLHVNSCTFNYVQTDYAKTAGVSSPPLEVFATAEEDCGNIALSKVSPVFSAIYMAASKSPPLWGRCW